MDSNIMVSGVAVVGAPSSVSTAAESLVAHRYAAAPAAVWPAAAIAVQRKRRHAAGKSVDRSSA